ncbi:hypothetical protein N3K66_002323 [Trichothecium roseum]|uniref:Uncharacterized protein n=1 Tax=Trichothecium roseum TaxID=47278 RepID=A0ACC0V993_9HYPO|nr:hypothetical protein N3K66_002323 [Trichothecium roseum]
MDSINSEAYDLDHLRGNFSASEGKEGHFFRCWLHSSCRSCLDADECSWCPYSWSCVPNSYRLPFLAPAYEDNICPADEEQWEIRTQPFGCAVSPITTISTVVAIFGTLTLLLLVFLTVLAAVRVRNHALQRRARRARARRTERWVIARADDGERDPLIPRSP